MADPTVQDRVKRYRAVQRNERGIRRVEVQVPEVARTDIQAVGKHYAQSHRRAQVAGRNLDFVLTTINAPRPHPIDGPTLVQCLMGRVTPPEWRPHIEAFFDEVSVEAIHDLVLAGVIDFEDLYRAARNWRVTDGRAVPWIKEMADLSLAAPAS